MLLQWLILQTIQFDSYRLEKHSAQLIHQIAYQSPKFMRPYMNPVLVALIPKLRMDISHVDVTVQVCLSEIFGNSFALRVSVGAMNF